MSVMGIDLTASSKRGSAFALLDDKAGLLKCSRFFEPDEIAGSLQKHKPEVVAIDAPLSLPLGLDCLEESHPCSPTHDYKGRSAEQDLARISIGCFFTTKRSIIKGLVYRGQDISRSLSNQGFKVIEVYPYATKVILFGKKMPSKVTSRGLAFLKDRISTMVNGLDEYMDKLNHDSCDAILAAYTGWLYCNGQTDALGIPEEGHIIVPKVSERAP